ncbi:MAG: DUF1501 domain-containing protein, partial [Phycisphaeraceae bacterium]
MDNHQPDPVARRSWSRRRLLQVGGIGLAGLTLPTVLRAESVEQGKAGAKRQDKSCIFIHQYGGLSQLDSWDMKPDAPVEIRGPYQTIKTATPGFHICELMPRLARMSDQYAVIRSMTHQMSQHDKANAMLLAGREKPAADDPSFGAIVTKLRPSEAALPGHVWLQKFGGGAAPPDHTYLTGGHLGMGFAPMLIGEKHDDNPASPDFRVRSFDTLEGISPQRLRSRRDLLEGFQRRSAAGATREFEALDVYQKQSFDLLQGGAARAAFDIDKESDITRDRYGRHPMGQNLLLARRLIEAGVRLVN